MGIALGIRGFFKNCLLLGMVYYEDNPIFTFLLLNF